MSGIFGFSYRVKSEENDVLASHFQKCLHGLDTWNRIYGKDGSETKLFSDSNGGIGCHLEHFSNQIVTSPILSNTSLNQTITVIDALLYNREELCSLLQIKDAKTISDESLLMKWIQAKGLDALKEVNGDFAGAIYEEKTKTWTLFRDHMGVRPLFYYKDDTVFAFSTDIRGIAAIPGIDLRINEKQLYLRIMGYNNLNLQETEFHNIHCIMPASWCTIQMTETGYHFQEHVYWKLGQKKIRFAKETDYQQEMRRLVEDAMKRRLDAVPSLIGGELSGGLDSCVIDILLNRLGNGRKAHYFSWSFDPKEHPLQRIDERHIIEEICKREQITCEYMPIQSENYVETLEQINPPYINTTNIRKTSAYLSQRGVRGIFTGHGGDEGISHRCHQLELWHHHEYIPYFKEKWSETEGKKLRFLRTCKRIYSNVAKEYIKMQLPWEGVSSKVVMLQKEFLETMKKEVRPEPLYFPIDAKAYINQGGSRNRLDNIAFQGAEHGVRYLVPFLDYRVIDFAVSIPRWLYRRGKINRYIYREAFRDLMPNSLYTLQSKDTPSMMGYKPNRTKMSSFEENKKNLLSRLDQAYWSQFFDFKAIEECLTIPNQVDDKTFYQIAFTMNQLYLCLMIQNVREKSLEWSEQKD